MALPKAIQREVDQASAIEHNLQQEAANPAEVFVENVEQLLTPPAPSASQPPEPVPAPPPAPVEDWQQKYRSLQGIFAQKTAELQTQVRTTESQINQLQQQLTELAKLKDAKPKERAAADPKDVENFGSDLIEMVQRYAEKMYGEMSTQFGQQAAALDARISALETQVTGVSQRADTTLEQQFYASLSGLVPDWEEINTDQQWLQWLSEVDSVYGAPRQAALDAAHQRKDVQRVAAVFKAFKASRPVKQQESLANQVAPTSAATPAPASPSTASKQILSAKFVEKFYRDMAQGKVYQGKDAEAARIEAEIDLAAAEGRIR